MTTPTILLDAAFKNFPTIQEDVRKIQTALNAQNAGKTLQQGFLPYVVACQNLITTSTKKLRAVHKDLDAALRMLSLKVQAAYAKIAPSDLMTAIRINDVATVSKILKITDLSKKKLPNKELPLHYAIRMKSFDVAKYFLKTARVDPFQVDDQQLTAINHAGLTKDPKMFACVLGASLGTTVSESSLSEKLDKFEVGMLEQEEKRLKNLPFMNPPIQAWHPLHRAAYIGDIEELKRLGKQKIDIDTSDSRGMTALHYASLSGKKEAVIWLLERKMKIDAKSANGMTPLHMAVLTGNVEVLKALIATKKFNLNDPDRSGRTPLHFALFLGHLPTARLLIANKADLFIKTMQTTPFAIYKEIALSLAFRIDPLNLDPISAFNFAAYTASYGARFFFPYYPALRNILAALPIFGKWVHAWIHKDALTSLGFAAINGNVQDFREKKMIFEGLQIASLAKIWFDQMRICWRNRSIETYRPLRNAVIHSANLLFSGLELLQSDQAGREDFEIWNWNWLSGPCDPGDTACILNAGKSLENEGLGAMCADTKKQRARMVFGLSEEFDPKRQVDRKDCKKKFRNLGKYHPDKCPTAECAKIMTVVNNAHDALNQCRA